MPLLAVREQVVKISGRTDLASADFNSVAGMDFYIRAAQDFLDGLVASEALTRVVSVVVDELEQIVPVDRLIRPIKIWRFEASGTPLMLKHLPTQVPSTNGSEKGLPRSYYLITKSIESSNTKRIVLHPVPTTEMTLFIEGVFLSPRLQDNTDVSFWTEQHPDILVQATQYKLESFYGNTQGANDFRDSVFSMMDALDNTLAEEMLRFRLQFENVW